MDDSDTEGDDDTTAASTYDINNRPFIITDLLYYVATYVVVYAKQKQPGYNKYKANQKPQWL